MSLLDVFKDFEFEDELEQDDSAEFKDNFSQLLKELSSGDEPEQPKLTKKRKEKAKRADLEDFEEAYTILKSIETVHKPTSYTSLNAFLHYRRKIDTDKRTVSGLTWPEHFETLSDSRLFTVEPEDLTKYADEEEGEDEQASFEGFCELWKSQHLHKSLLRTVHASWSRKSLKPLDDRLANSIALRTAFLLQSVFDRAVLNRKSALKVLKQFPQVEGVDIDNVPINWRSTREAAGQLLGQAGLDKETFTNFSSRLDRTFS